MVGKKAEFSGNTGEEWFEPKETSLRNVMSPMMILRMDGYGGGHLFLTVPFGNRIISRNIIAVCLIFIG